MSAAKPETHERAERMVAERLGFRLHDYTRTTLGSWAKTVYPSYPQAAIQPATHSEISLWSEAVRLQAEILEQEGK